MKVSSVLESEDKVDITPMIDVVFQLLIYFLVATNFALGEQVFRLDLPDRSGASEFLGSVNSILCIVELTQLQKRLAD